MNREAGIELVRTIFVRRFNFLALSVTSHDIAKQIAELKMEFDTWVAQRCVMLGKKINLLVDSHVKI